MTEKSKVVVCRAWTAPEIRAYVNAQEVGIEVALDDFIQCVAEEMGNPTLLVTKAQLVKKLMEAKERVVVEFKKATVHV